MSIQAMNDRNEARERAAKLQRELSATRAALKPFAALLDRWRDDADTPPIRKGQTTIEMGIKIADLERAKRVIG